MLTRLTNHIIGCSDGSAAIQEEYTPLYLAIEEGNDEIIKLLLMDDRTDVNLINKEFYYENDGSDMEITQNDDSPLFSAIVKKNLLLTNEKTDVNILCTYQNCSSNKLVHKF